MRFCYRLSGHEVAVQIEGETVRGEQRVLLEDDDDLTLGQTWHEQGFTIVPFVRESSYRELVDDVTARFAVRLREAEADSGTNFTLTHYHRYVRDDAMHLRVLNDARVGYPLVEFPFDLAEVTDRISSLLGKRVKPRNEQHGVNRWHVRVVRPRSNDHNPLHRDVWLDRLRNAVNLYVPLAGSDEDSSLPIAPGSHRWFESDLLRTAQGAFVNGVSYTVPAVAGSDRPLHLVRPNPGPNEVLLFSPYLVHGGARNFAVDRTRMSLEMRFWRDT